MPANRQARYHFTQLDQVTQLVGASRAGGARRPVQRRADVSRLEQALQHVRDEIAKAVKALADYAREYWDRNRQEQLARQRDDLGRTR